MSQQIRFDNRVAIVTGAGAGLGRRHALGLAARGAKVIVNDFGGRVDGTGASLKPAEETVAMIEAAGGTALAHGADISDMNQVQDMVDLAMRAWGRIDILVNNAGILRDRTFAKMTTGDFAAVMDVHLMGSVHCSLAVWPVMRAANYGRIAMTTSSSGLYGNFGQSNYAAAKMAVVGLMNVLDLEGAKSNIRVNTLAPAATTRMTEELLTPNVAGLMDPNAVTPGLLFLVSEEAPARTVLCAGAGGFSRTYIHETEGVWLAPQDWTPEAVAANFEAISDPTGQHLYANSGGQVLKFLQKAAAAAGVKLA